jgi:ubiquinone/menaquinone biosynthesis C-methylase UbiE
VSANQVEPVVKEYAEAAKVYDKKWSFYVNATTLETMSRLPVARSDRVLDVGCGTGELLARLAAKYPAAHLSGLDPVPEMLEVAREKLSERVELRVGWANELPWPEASFDLVVSCNMFHYITHPVVAVQEMERVLRPGGRLGDYRLVRRLLGVPCVQRLSASDEQIPLQNVSASRMRGIAEGSRTRASAYRAIQNQLALGANDGHRGKANFVS